MKIQIVSTHPYETTLIGGGLRSGLFLYIADERGLEGWGEVAPLPKWSRETLEECLEQFHRKREAIVSIDWTTENLLQELSKLSLLPALSFGVESALLSLLAPLPEHSIPTSALLMGSPQAILDQATLRKNEGYTSAKLKVGHLTFEEAASLIHQLKETFRLRIDVNRAWTTLDSLHFFSQFALDAFDYVEEPFQNPHDLALFAHPLAVDESFPQELSLTQLESLPMLKALIYKPTIQGGMLGCLQVQAWARKNDLQLVLSSSFESDIGLSHITSMAHRLSLSSPIGIGTYHCLTDHVCAHSFQLTHSVAHVSTPPALCPSVRPLALFTPGSGRGACNV